MLTEIDFSALIIVVVDETQFMRRLAVDILSSFGAKNIVETQSFQGAMSDIQLLKPDLILCGRPTDDAEGLSLLQKLRTHPEKRLAQIPLLLITGRASDDYVTTAIKAGASSFIVAPYSIATLLAHLLRILEQAADAQEVWEVA